MDKKNRLGNSDSTEAYNRATRTWKCPDCGHDGAEDVYVCRWCDRLVDVEVCPDCSEPAPLYPRCDRCGHIDKTAPQN